MYKAIVIKPGEQPVIKELNLNSLKAELDGGWLEGLRFTDDSFAFIDEEGKLKQLPINVLATELCTKYEVGLNPSDVICGTFIIVGTLNKNGKHDGKNHDAPHILVEQIVGE